ncbi:MAG: ABC transporter permease [Bacteroidetes bacterium]|nr:ABC transporter permease [Bacteroidota bacterium]
MKRILRVVKKEFLQLRRDKRMFGMLFVAPVLQLILLGYAATVDVKNIPIVICDLDNTKESRELLSHFTSSGYFTTVAYIDDVNQVDYYLKSGKAGMAIIVPVHFGRDLQAGRTPQLAVIADGSDSNTSGIGLSYASTIALNYARNIVVKRAESYNLIKNANDLPQVVAQTRAWYNPDLESVNFMVPAVLVMVLMVITLTITSLAIVKEKENGTIEQIVVTPLHDLEFILGKMIPFILIGMVEVLLVLFVSVYVFHVPLRGNVITLLVLSLLFIMVALGLGLLVSSISKTQQQATMTAQFFVMMPMLILSGFIFPIENMPRFFQYITYLIPVRYFMEIVRGIFLKGDGFADLWPQTLALFAIGVVVLSMSVYTFRRSIR